MEASIAFMECVQLPDVTLRDYEMMLVALTQMMENENGSSLRNEEAQHTLNKLVNEREVVTLSQEDIPVGGEGEQSQSEKLGDLFG